MENADHGKPFRLGFAVKTLGRPDIKSNDSRRWQSNPHLRVSLDYLRQMLEYLYLRRIRMYRMSSDLAPYATHPDMPQFHGMIKECSADLAEIGAKARSLDIRLSFHPSQFIVLNSPDSNLVKKSIDDLSAQSEMLDCMSAGPEAVVVIHTGGAYDDKPAAMQRWVHTWKKLLPEHVKNRLVLENDDLRFSAADVLQIHEQTGVRLIFDYQHFWCMNSQQLDLRETVQKFLSTWPAGVRPKIHFSTPRSEMREVTRKNKKSGKNETAFVAPVWTGHADFCNPFEFCTFMRTVNGFKFDVMLESKSKDLALIRLRADMLRYAPDVAAKFGLKEAAREQAEVDEVLRLEAGAE
ncbi:MAG: UV DNA damage repair endonuclease UvsE [Verrucomicrobiales bacterium]